MTAADPQRHHEALDWIRRMHEADFDDWDAHVAWLEADPRNSEAFDMASVLIEDGTMTLAPAAARSVAEAINDNGEAPVRRFGMSSRWIVGLGGAVAASIAALLVLPTLTHSGAQPYRIETAPGVSRMIALSDGTKLALNGDSAVELDHKDPRSVRLARGEAFFQVVHDNARPFTVQAGNSEFRDVGTSFDLVRDRNGVRLSVHEGAVMFDPEGTALQLGRGQQIAIDAHGAQIAQIDAATVGGWREGRLSYQDTPFALVAADLARTIGMPIKSDPQLAARRFSGVIILGPDRDVVLRRVASVMGAKLHKDGSGWQVLSNAP